MFSPQFLMKVGLRIGRGSLIKLLSAAVGAMDCRPEYTELLLTLPFSASFSTSLTSELTFQEPDDQIEVSDHKFLHQVY